MTSYFKKESLKFDGINYESCKEKMETHLISMGPKFCLVTKSKKDVIEGCEGTKIYIFMQNMLAREASLLALLET